MIKAFDCKGQWWLPGGEKVVSGTLNYDPNFKPELELIGSLEGILSSEQKDVILGKTDVGNITLLNNWSISSRFNSNGISIERYNAGMILMGYHFESELDIKFEKVSFSVFNLFQWINISGISRKIHSPNNTYSINYEKIQNIEFEIKDICQAKIGFYSPINNSREYNRIELHEQCFVEFTYNYRKYYKEILQDISAFIGLVTLCTYEQSYPMDIFFTDSSIMEEGTKNPLEKKIELHYNLNNFDLKYKIKYNHESLIKFQDIQNCLGDIISKWFSNYMRLKPEHYLVLRYFKNRNKFSEDNFMDIIRAVESYHRLYFKNKRCLDQEYVKRVESILSRVKLCESDMNFLKTKLKKENTNLKDRILYLVRKYNNTYIDRQFGDQKLIQDIIISRNYYSHYDKKIENSALKGEKLYRATLKLLGLIFSCILTDCGIERKYFENKLFNLLPE